MAFGHHRDPVGDFPHDAEVVGNEQHGHAVPLLQRFQQRENLGLHRHVERRGRLVGDQQLGIIRQRHGDHDARKLVRIIVDAAFGIGNTDFIEEPDRAPQRFGLAQPLMQPQHLGNLLADRVHRVKRTHRLLEDHADLVAAHGPQRVLIGPRKILPAEHHAAGNARSRWKEPQHGKCRHRLARAAFPHQRQRLARRNVKTDPPHRLERAETNGKVAN
jgi:hypothetical protein